jgi:hypothetical protein
MENNKLKYIPNKPVPYNTGKLKIGVHYVPPQKNYMDAESEHWQNVLTGVHKYRAKDKMQFILYLVGLAVLVVLLWGAK